MFLLETNICIFAIKKKSQKLLDQIADNVKSGMYIPSLTIAEMEYCISNSMHPERNWMAWLEFLTIFEVLDFTEKDAIPYGTLKTKLKRSGKLIGPIDMLLAGQAISNNLILITNNTKEFSRVKDLEIQDWSV